MLSLCYWSIFPLKVSQIYKNLQSLSLPVGLFVFPGLYELMHDNTTESKRTINILQRMNIYQEVFLSILYRILHIQVFNLFYSLCWKDSIQILLRFQRILFIFVLRVRSCMCLFCRPTWSQFISTSTQCLLCRLCMSSLSLSRAGYSVTPGWPELSLECGTFSTGIVHKERLRSISHRYTYNLCSSSSQR